MGIQKPRSQDEYKAVIIPTLSMAVKRVQNCHNKILNIRCEDRQTNVSVLTHANIPSVGSKIIWHQLWEA